MHFVSDFMREQKRNNNRGRCLHFANDNRCNEIVSAHSIQKRGQLSLIEEKGHVYRLNGDLSTLGRTGGKLEPKKIGINKVSTFAGFCKYHDNELFEKIDNYPFEPNKLQASLYAYRCLCREYFSKENAVSVLEAMKNHVGLSEGSKTFLKHSLYGNVLGFERLKYHKLNFDSAIKTRKFEEFEFISFVSQSRFEAQFSGQLFPDYDFHGRFLQNLGDVASPLDLITFYTSPTRGGWAFTFCWHRSSSRTCSSFIQSLASCVAEGQKIEDVLLRFSFTCCENHAFRISWWDALDMFYKNKLLEAMAPMVDLSVPVPPDYLVSGCENIANWNFEHVFSTLQADN